MASLSQEGFNFLKGLEGYKNKPYHLKGEKYYTVGLGHFGPDVDPNRIYTDAECMAFFAQDKQRFEIDVNKVWHEPMTQNMFDALFSMAYNHGNVSRTILKNLCAGNGFMDREKITKAWCNMYTVNGLLTNRRKKEVAFFYGVDSVTPLLASPYSPTGFAPYSPATTSIYSSGTDYSQPPMPNPNYPTYESAFSGARLNTSTLQSQTIVKNSQEHTRIYTATEIDSSRRIVLDELSIPVSEADLADASIADRINFNEIAENSNTNT